jgi:Transposase DDE domain
MPSRLSGRGAASPVTPKFISRSDPAAQWTGAHKGHAFFAYSTNYLIDTDHGVIVDVEATRAIRQAEVGAARTMLERTQARFGVKPDSLTADSAYGSAESLAWLVKQKGITPLIPVFDKSNRTDGTFSRADFAFDAERNRYTCPAGKELVQFRRSYATPRSGVTAEGTRLYRASKLDCDICKLKPQCCPNALARKVPRDLHEDARDVATPEYVEACRRRKKVEMLFAHLKRIIRLTRLRLRGPNGAKDEFLLAATAQNLRRLARLRPINMLPEMLAT